MAIIHWKQGLLCDNSGSVESFLPNNQVNPGYEETLPTPKCFETCQQACTASADLEPFSKQALVFTCLLYKTFENTVGKGEIARYKQFLLFPQCFLPILRTFCHFHRIWYCHLQTFSVWKSLKFVVWERVKTF